MSSVLSGVEGLATGAVESAAGFGLGFALSHALGPLATTIRQDTYELDPTVAVDPGTAAQIVAEAVEALDWGRGEAAKHGIDSERFDAIVGEVLNAPGFGELMAMRRRGTIDDADFLHGLRKAKLETRWDEPAKELSSARLDPSAIATAIHRGIIAGQGLLVREPPAGEGHVPHVAQSAIDAEHEAAAWGYDSERLRVLVGNTGLPLSLGEMLQLKNRGKVTDDDVRRSIAQSNVRNEYMDVALDLARRLLTPHEYAELALRGYITDAERDAGAALSGMDAADTELLFKMLGRSLAVHQVTTGLARGGKYGGDYEGVPEPYLSALRESNVKPPWGNLAYANRYTYPSAFVLRSMAQTGELSPDDVHKTLLEIGWRPDFAEKVTQAWTGGKQTKGDPHVGKAETQVWTALHRSYVDDATDDAKATADLEALGVAPSAVPEVLRLWQLERAIVRRELTPKEIKKAIGQPGKDTAWAKARLIELGYSDTDADTFLAE